MMGPQARYGTSVALRWAELAGLGAGGRGRAFL